MRVPSLRGIPRVLGAGVLILAASAAAVWPVWALATRARGPYTAAVGLAALVLAAWALGRRLSSRRHRRGRRRGAAR